jgi:hypothetical protein
LEKLLEHLKKKKDEIHQLRTENTRLIYGHFHDMWRGAKGRLWGGRQKL